MPKEKYCDACGKPGSEFKTGTAWGKLGYCSVGCLRYESGWLFDQERAEFMSCYCPSPSNHLQNCVWINANKRKTLLIQLGYDKESVLL